MSGLWGGGPGWAGTMGALYGGRGGCWVYFGSQVFTRDVSLLSARAQSSA